MQSKITLKRFRGGLRKTLMALGLVGVLAVSTKAQTYVNGNLGTGTVARNGSTAPTGFQWHEIQNDNGTTTIANSTLAVNVTGTYSLADDFTVPAGATWTITKFTSYFIQPTAGTVTAAYVRIYNGNPSAGGTVVYGDLTTNRLATTSAAGMYGVFNSLVPPTNPATSYPITQVDANVSTVLPAGTYWIQWQLVSGAATYSPTSQIVGVRSQPTYNAIQSTSGAWAAIVDGGVTAAGAAAGVNVPVELPFKLAYTSTGGTACTGTPAPGATIASVTTVCPATTFNLSLTTPTTGTGVTYQWQSSATQTGTYTNIVGATAATLTYSQAASTWYRAQVTCGGNTGTSTPVNVAASTGCYCIPAFSDCTDGDIITNVTLDALNNTSTCSASGYTNYTTNTAITVPNVVIGGANPISVTAGSGAYTESVAVWIDYNQNGTFETSEYTLLGTSATALKTANIVVPATALTGKTRMRVRVQYSAAWVAGGACTTAYLGYGETEDYSVNMVPCTPITFTTQPASASVACGGTVKFTAAVSGSLPVYQWESKAPAATVWTNVTNNTTYSGATTAVLTVNASDAITGTQYRLVVNGACSATDVSSVATLTVTKLVGSVLPASAAVCAGAGTVVPLSIANTASSTTATFSSAANLNLTIPDNGATVGVNNTIPVTLPAGAQVTDVKVKFNITHSWVGDLILVLKAPNGKIVNLAYALTGTGGAAASTGFTNTVIANGAYPNLVAGTNPYTATFKIDGFGPATGDPTVPTGPNGYVPVDGTTLPDLYGGAGAGTGNWTLALYDYYEDDLTTNKFVNWSLDITYGAPATGIFTANPATPNTIFTNPGATTAYDGVTPINTVYVKPTVSTVYTVVINTGTCTTTTTVPVTVAVRPTGLAVANKTICANNNTSFTVTTTAGSGYTTSWQVSTNGGVTYSTIANGGVYSTATTNTLTLTNVPASYNGYKYRAILASAPCATFDTSAAATLTVNATPQIVINVGPYTSLLPNLTTTLTAAVSPNAATTYTWYRNGVIVAGATGNRLVVGVDALGTYTATVSDVNACGSAVSNAITITDSTSGKLFVYPNPNSGVFQVRYHALAGNTLVRGLNIYDDKGAKIYAQQYTQSAPYARMDVNLPLLSSGAYWAEVVDLNGNRLAVSKFVVQK